MYQVLAETEEMDEIEMKRNDTRQEEVEENDRNDNDWKSVWDLLNRIQGLILSEKYSKVPKGTAKLQGSVVNYIAFENIQHCMETTDMACCKNVNSCFCSYSTIKALILGVRSGSQEISLPFVKLRHRRLAN